jgi:DNA mismatch repair ATPase MutS
LGIIYLKLDQEEQKIMTQENPETIYKERIKHIDEQLKDLKKKDTVMGILKLVLIIVGLLALFRVFSIKPPLSLGIFGFSLLSFVIITIMHETILRKIKFQKNMKTINENEIKMLYHEFPAQSFNGEEFNNPDHNYTSDLDIFGEKSVFHYISRAVTAVGRKWLAKWLQTQDESNEIKKRQEAVKELSGKLDLRQTIACHGMLIDDTSQKLEFLYTLLKEPITLLNRKFFITFMHVWPIITIGAGILIFFKVSWIFFVGFIVSQLIINKPFLKHVSHIYSLTSRSGKILKAYSHIIAEIENENYCGEKLGLLKKQLSVNNKNASVCIGKLSTLLEYFDARNGSLHGLINNLVLWDLHCLYRLEKWIKKTGPYVPQWFDVIGEFESLSGFANLHFNNPSWTMPEIIHEGQFQMEAEEMGHPLIPKKDRVCNQFELNSIGQGNGNLAIVTGPNMAGKSTFLRTIGVNIVLAFTGAPVCASRFKISPLKLFSSMQTSDSLDKHLSLFYAELQRLKMILDGISHQEQVFFLVDEMLKGTNATDRQKGAIAMLKQLMKNRANGVVATHDLKLTKLENPEEWENYPQGINIYNYHFDGYIKGDKLLFDYKLKIGICESFNALILMKKMGIEL